MTTGTKELSDKKTSAPRTGVFFALVRFTREKPLGAAGAVIFIVMVLAAITAQWISPYDPTATELAVRLTPPSAEHWLGTDKLGRDMLSRLIYGARISAIVGIAATLISTTFGTLIGIISGYLGGRKDMYIQRVMDMLMSFPGLILAIAIMAALGPSVVNVIIAISIPGIPRTNRVIRSVSVSLKEFQYVEAAQAVGATQSRIIFRHILPNCIAPFLILVTSALAGAILVEASLSFLGLGIPPPTPSWGRSLLEAMDSYIAAPWLAIFPGLAISLVVFGANMFGDALRDVLDPRLKRL
jgi:peptide/nickel transport system permease protein